MAKIIKAGFIFVGLFLTGIFSVVTAQHMKIYVGTYTSIDGSKGVQFYDFDQATGRTSFLRTLPMSNPSFLAKKGQMLYAVNEDNEGMLSAVDIKSGAVVDVLPTKGAHPCHVALSPNLPVAVVSNYTGGSLILFSLKEDGRLDRQEDFIAFNGNSIDRERQTQSHIHSAFFSADGKQLFVSDLGADLIYVYEIEQKTEGLRFRSIGNIKTKKGGGPRHLVVADDAKTLYSVLELTGELEVFQYKKGGWHSVQVLPIYTKDFIGKHGAADIKISPDRKFVYATNRGDANVIACYEVLRNNTLRAKSITSTGGISPRNLNISENGQWVFVTNQQSNEITVFRRNQKTGELLADRSSSISISKPVCLIY